MALNIKSAFEFIGAKRGVEPPLKARVIFFPESFGEGVVVENRNIFLHNQSPLVFPKDLVVNGAFEIKNCSKITLPENLTAANEVSLDHVNIQELSSNIKSSGIYLINLSLVSITGILNTSRLYLKDLPQLTKLPDLPKIERLFIDNVAIRTLPENLSLTHLCLKNAKIAEIPNSASITEEIEINNPDIVYPEHLENIISYRGVRIRTYKDFINQPARLLQLGKFSKVVHNTTLPYGKGRMNNNIKLRENLSKTLGITWTSVTEDLIEMTRNYITTVYYYEGVDREGRKYLFAPIYSNIKLYTETGVADVKTFAERANVTPELKQKILDQLFPTGEKKKKVKSTARKASDIVKDPTSPKVEFTFGRINRSGKGIEGDPNTLIESVAARTAENIRTVGQVLGITWEKMYIYNLNDEAMVAVFGKTADGKEFMYDKYGSGMGGFSKVRSGRSVVNVSTVVGSRVKAQDFQ